MNSGQICTVEIEVKSFIFSQAVYLLPVWSDTQGHISVLLPFAELEVVLYLTWLNETKTSCLWQGIHLNQINR